jgi:ABC-type sugar transport system ATPase subunit
VLGVGLVAVVGRCVAGVHVLGTYLVGRVTVSSRLVGAGRSELAHAIYGATRVASGRVLIGDIAHPGGVAAGIRCGVALIPESRRHQGLILRRSVVDHVTLPLLDRFRTVLGLARMASYHRRTFETSWTSNRLC